VNNEFYARDTSLKIYAVNKAAGALMQKETA